MLDILSGDWHEVCGRKAGIPNHQPLGSMTFSIYDRLPGEMAFTLIIPTSAIEIKILFRREKPMGDGPELVAYEVEGHGPCNPAY